MRITGERIYLRPFQITDANQKLAFHIANKAFLKVILWSGMIVFIR